LQKIFIRLRNVGLKGNLAKWKFGAINFNCLEYRLTSEEILPVSEKLKATRHSKSPKRVQEIKQFMGLCDFAWSYVRNFARIGAPLNRLSSKKEN
jgi:hypothetical protein